MVVSWLAAEGWEGGTRERAGALGLARLGVSLIFSFEGTAPGEIIKKCFNQ